MYFDFLGIKIVQNCLVKMDENHIKLLAKQCHQVILMKKKGNNEKTHFWKIQERGYAAQLLARCLYIIYNYNLLNLYLYFFFKLQFTLMIRVFYIVCLDY